jgi:hypothetical protein
LIDQCFVEILDDIAIADNDLLGSHHQHRMLNQ